MRGPATRHPNRLGIDIGRVIILAGTAAGTADTSFVGGDLQNALKTPPAPGAFEAVGQLTRAFERRVWLISKAGPRTETFTREWLAHHRFFERTGIPTTNVRFCRAKREKVDHCKELGITHFIDDRLQVLQLLKGIVPYLYHFGAEPSGSQVFTAVRGWREAVECILPLDGPEHLMMKSVKSCGILVFKSGPPREFLLMRHPNRWDLPKGHIKSGESESKCALRELEEETGITGDLIELDTTFRFEHVYHPKYRRLGGAQVEKTVVIFLGWLKRPVEIQPKEHATFQWLPWSPPHLIQERTVDPLLKQVASHFEREAHGPTTRPAASR